MVGELIEIASKKGKKQNKKIKLGICGEHGGDPKSIYFCSKINLDYVSCSPYRVPVARLSAAQAELKKNYISSFKSAAGALWVMLPIEILLTPVLENFLTDFKVIFPEASVS